MLSESVLNSELTVFCTVTWAITPSITTDLNRLPTKVALHCRQMVLPSLIDDGAKQDLLCLVKRSLTNKGEVEKTCGEQMSGANHQTTGVQQQSATFHIQTG